MIAFALMKRSTVFDDLSRGWNEVKVNGGKESCRARVSLIADRTAWPCRRKDVQSAR